MTRLSDSDRAGLDAARALVEAGVPVFLAEPARDGNGEWLSKGGHQGTGYWLPKAWEKSTPDPRVVDRWMPGMALCAVMGHAVDGLDVDPRSGGDVSLAQMMAEGLVPRSYGHQSTPSGGTHDLIASLGVTSKNGLLPGIDLKAGNAQGQGRGFLFIAPTRKVAQDTGKVGTYRWETAPDLGMLLLGTDDSGAPLAALRASCDPEPVVTVEADGTPYADLQADLQLMARERVERVLAEVSRHLADVATWEDDRDDSKGHGWDVITRNAAMRVARLGYASWAPITWEEARDTFTEMLPEVMAQTVGTKWPKPETVATHEQKDPTLAPWQEVAADFDALPPEPLSEVWDASTTLATIRQAAHARLLSAPALLAVVLARVLVEVPPSVALPPVVGSRASLNFGVAIVGSSGSGKSALMAVSRELLGLTGLTQEALERSIGSGEGLVQTFLRWDTTVKANVLLDDPRRLVLADEIDQLAATQGRSGATLAPVVRSALTGAALGQENADATRRRHVPAGRYRLGLVVGVQPTRAGALLDDADAGTPQRLLWCRATDPTLPADVPEWPAPLDWQPPELGALVDYPAAIKAEVRAVRVAHVRDGADGLTGHRMLLHLKVAAALALLHGDAEISQQWWQVAGVLVDASGDVQGECREVLAAEVTEQRRALGRLDGIRAEGQATYEDEQVRSAAVKVWGVVDRHSRSKPDGNAQRHGRADGCTSRCISKALQHRANRHEVQGAALAYGVEAEWLTEVDGRWLPGTSQPGREAS